MVFIVHMSSALADEFFLKMAQNHMTFQTIRDLFQMGITHTQKKNDFGNFINKTPHNL